MSTTITDRLRDLYFSERKPKDLTPTDMALLTYLLLRESEDHFIFDSQETIGARLGCDRRTVAKSIERLETLGWPTVNEQWEWNPKKRRKTRAMYAPSGLSVNLDRLPASGDRATRNKPSDDAKDLAAQHGAILVQNGVGSRYKRSPRRFTTHQEQAAQRLIDECGSSPEAAAETFNFALNHPAHKKAALTSLYAVRRRLGRIREDMESAGQVGAEG